jgi:hypothetical protein
LTGNDQKRNRLRQQHAAEDLAATQLDRMTDAHASTEVNASRKKRLMQGPEEFRSFRQDGPAERD